MFGIARLPTRGGNAILSAKSKRGLFQGAKTKHGYKSGPDNWKVKVKRVFKPNSQKRRLWSETLERDFRLHVTQRAQRTIDKHGGLDAYLIQCSHRRLGPGIACDMKDRVLETLRTGVDPKRAAYEKYEAEHELAVKDYVARRDLAAEAVVRKETQMSVNAFNGPWRAYGGANREAYMEATKRHDERSIMARKLMNMKDSIKDIEDEARGLFNKMSLDDKTKILPHLQVLDETQSDRGSEADRMLKFRSQTKVHETVPVAHHKYD